ncbi:MAG: metallophosphoesterase, partial [Clostridia bacterium]|nr:metallophosphoesterase [Clostridia bacterium]
CTVMLDHQPNDYAAEAAAGMDLVLSGHTHGGHIFPAGQIGLWIGANDFLYGTTRIGQTDFVVTSGISGWAIPFKTGTFSEYVVIDLVPKD